MISLVVGSYFGMPPLFLPGTCIPWNADCVTIMLPVQDLPESMAKLKKLERLDLGDNEIEELPPHIGALVSLEGKKLSTAVIKNHCYGSALVSMRIWIPRLRSMRRRIQFRNDSRVFDEKNG
jgi:hypothetical protein